VGPHPPPPGGMANFIQNLESSSLKNIFQIEGFDSDYPRFLKKLRPLTLLWLPFMYLQYLYILSARRPSLVHVNTPSFSSFYKHMVFVTLAKSRSIPVVLHIHGGRFRDFYENSSGSAQLNIRRKLALADRLIVLSNKWAEFFITLCPGDRIRVVENGIPLEKFKPPTKIEKRKGTNFIFVGEVKPAKGMDELLDAFSRLAKNNPDYKLVVVGSGKIERYRKFAKELGIESNFRFMGERTGDELVRLYSEADIFIFPSHSEGMPLVVLESMAMKLAVIATSVGSIPEILSKEGGILVPPKDSSALENAIKALAGNVNRINSMGEANRKIIETRFSFERVVEQLRVIYIELISP
jgi:glycosyltransferase involved in cell wall biosynthesis